MAKAPKSTRLPATKPAPGRSKGKGGVPKSGKGVGKTPTKGTRGTC